MSRVSVQSFGDGVRSFSQDLLEESVFMLAREGLKQSLDSISPSFAIRLSSWSLEDIVYRHHAFLNFLLALRDHHQVISSQRSIFCRVLFI